MLKKSDIVALNIEHTSYCNLKCPQCARVLNGHINEHLHMSSMTLTDYMRILPPSFCKQIDHIFFCGNYGDPLADAHFLDCVKYLKINNIRLTIYTNGSLRTMNWWKELAIILGKDDKVIFAIDGLEDTNHIYRVGANFRKVMRNATTFIVNGGKARWDYLVFEHNHHQVEEAKEIAKTMGFHTFNEKQTKRFIADKNYKTNKGGGKFGQIIEKYGTWENYIDQTEIHCKYKDDGILYIDFDLNLWPCCWVGAPMFFYSDNLQRKQLVKLLNRYKPGFNSLRLHTIDEILEHQWFKNDLVDSWTKKMCEGKLMTCGRTCGTEYKFSSGDKSNKKEIEL
jgi:MoaA/NifB/PqqE/SkfB family radical SAM enzyme